MKGGALAGLEHGSQAGLSFAVIFLLASVSSMFGGGVKGSEGKVRAGSWGEEQMAVSHILLLASNSASIWMTMLLHDDDDLHLFRAAGLSTCSQPEVEFAPELISYIDWGLV